MAKPASSIPNSISGALLFYAAATFLSSLKDAGVKDLGVLYPVSEIVVIRLTGDLIPAAAMVLATGRVNLLATSRWQLHLVRALCMGLTMALLYLSLRSLPLAMVTALFMLGPSISAVLSPLFLHESPGRINMLVLMLGLMGAEIIINPTVSGVDLRLLLPVAAAFNYSLVNVISRELGKTDTTVAIAANGSLLVVITLVTFTSTSWNTPSLSDSWPLLLLVTCGGLSSYFYVAACRRAPLPLVVPLDYLLLIFSATWGIIIWHEQPPSRIWIGGALIVSATMFSSLTAFRQTPSQGLIYARRSIEKSGDEVSE